jgi:predicted CopG family antitoxin
MEKTTIQINVETLERLRTMKNFERQSYDDVLNVLIENQTEENLSNEEIAEIQKGLEDIKLGRTKSIEQVAKEFGVALR